MAKRKRKLKRKNKPKQKSHCSTQTVINSNSLTVILVVLRTALINVKQETRDEIPERDIDIRPPTKGFPFDDLRKILRGGQRMAKVQNGEEILPKVSTP